MCCLYAFEQVNTPDFSKTELQHTTIAARNFVDAYFPNGWITTYIHGQQEVHCITERVLCMGLLEGCLYTSQFALVKEISDIYLSISTLFLS